MSIVNSVKKTLSNIFYPHVAFSEKKPFKFYVPELENKDFAVYMPTKEKIVAAYDKAVCTQPLSRKDILFLYPDVHVPNRRFKIQFNSDSFPGLISGSHILLVLIVPYIPKEGDRTPKWRMAVVTDKCQVYHNYPDGVSHHKGIIAFEESLIWDLPGNKYPSLSELCEDYEYYYPFLPESCYEYHPAGKTPKHYRVTYEDGRVETLSRFYFPKRSALTNPFYYLNGYEPDPLMTFIGSYAGNSSANDASRIVVFATHDGGKNWFAKYEFNDDGRAKNYGNSLSNRGLIENEDSISWKLCKKEWIPSENDATQTLCKSSVNVMKAVWNDTLELTCDQPHGLSSGNIITLKGDGKTKAEKALFNNGFNDGYFGNGVFYKVKVIDDITVQLYECVSKSKTNLPARHIHSINRVKNGFLIATGEMYPQGWLMLISLTDSDNWNVYLACDEIPFIRLNSARDSVQRIVGAIMLDNKEDHELIYASDCSSMNIKHIEIVDGIPTNQMGIYKGKLDDIDDFRKFTLLEEVKEPSFFFKNLDGCYVYCGQRGELALGFDRGKTWRHGKLDTALVHYMGRTANYFVIDGKILRIK